MTLAIGMCEESGLIMALLQDKLRNVPPVILPFVVAFVGTVGNLASDTAMVVIPPSPPSYTSAPASTPWPV